LEKRGLKAEFEENFPKKKESSLSFFEKNLKKILIFLKIQLTKSKKNGIIIVAVYAKMLCLYSKKIKHNLSERTFDSNVV